MSKQPPNFRFSFTPSRRMMKNKTRALVRRLLDVPSADNELRAIAKTNGIPLAGIHMRNERAIQDLDVGNYLINMDSETGDGTHWVGLVVTQRDPFRGQYFDSFGFPPPNSLLRLSEDGILQFNDIQIQRPDELMCGLYALAFLMLRKRISFADIVDSAFVHADKTFSTRRNKVFLMNLLG